MSRDTVLLHPLQRAMLGGQEERQPGNLPGTEQQLWGRFARGWGEQSQCSMLLTQDSPGNGANFTIHPDTLPWRPLSSPPGIPAHPPGPVLPPIKVSPSPVVGAFSIAHSGFHLLAPGCSQTLLAYLPKTLGFCALGHSDSSLCPSAQGEEPAPHSRQENSGTLMSVKELRPEILGFDSL